MKNLLLSLCILFCSFPLFADSNEQELSAKLESATILQVGAELTHTVKASLKSGTNELVITDISSIIDANSLQVKCSGGVTVLATEFSTNYLTAKEDSPEVKRIQDSIEICEYEITRLKTALAINDDIMELLRANKKVGSEQTGLNVADFIKMIDYYENKLVELQTEHQKNKHKAYKINEKLNSYRNQLEQEKTKNNKAANVLKLRLASPSSGSKDLTITYYTRAAMWTPFYDIQISESNKPVKIISKAKFMQTTGLDWKNVKLSLSTALPNNGKTAPKFSAWFLRNTSASSPHAPLLQNSISQKSISSSSRKDLYPTNIEVFEANNNQADDSFGYSTYMVNGEFMTAEQFEAIDPSFIKTIEVVNGQTHVTLKDVNDYVTQNVSDADFIYDITTLYDLPGNGKEQSVTLSTIELPAKFEYYCAPKLDKAVFLLANIDDWEKHNLLPGEAYITREGTYIGKTVIEPYLAQKTLNLSLGTDKRIIVKREKQQDYSSTRLIGSNKVQAFTYQLTVKNNKTVAIDMVVKDQYPTSTRKDIEVEVLDKGNADIENQQVGVLTWTFTLQPGETRVIQHSYSVKYPKNETLNL